MDSSTTDLLVPIIPWDRGRLEVAVTPRSFEDNVEFWSLDLMMKASVRLWNHKNDRKKFQS